MNIVALTPPKPRIHFKSLPLLLQHSSIFTLTFQDHKMYSLSILSFGLVVTLTVPTMAMPTPQGATDGKVTCLGGLRVLNSDWIDLVCFTSPFSSPITTNGPMTNRAIDPNYAGRNS
jgi:hypothetical protein